MSSPEHRTPSAACPLPDGSLCGTCPDCQADAINDAQWPDGGIAVAIPEQPAAFSYDYERILDLVQRIQHCQRDVSNSIHDRTLEGSLRARNYAEQIRVDVSELQDLLLARHLAIQKEADSRV